MQAIKNCVKCGYLLVGHTGRCSCPECGLSYEDGSAVIVSPYTRWHPFANAYVAFGILATLLVYLAFHVAALLTSPPATNILRGLAWLSLLTVVIAIFSLRTYYRRHGWIPFVAVLPDGVYACPTGKSRDIRRTTWEEIRTLEINTATDWQFMQSFRRVARIAVKPQDIGALREAVALKLRVNSHAARVDSVSNTP